MKFLHKSTFSSYRLLSAKIFNGDTTMKNRIYYEREFENYPDLVKLTELKEMLGNIGEGTIKKLLKANHIKHYFINYQCA